MKEFNLRSKRMNNYLTDGMFRCLRPVNIIFFGFKFRAILSRFVTFIIDEICFSSLSCQHTRCNEQLVSNNDVRNEQLFT